jgi:hypothetical protein
MRPAKAGIAARAGDDGRSAVESQFLHRPFSPIIIYSGGSAASAALPTGWWQINGSAEMGHDVFREAPH